MPPRSTLSRREWASAEHGVTILARHGGGTVRVGGVRLTVWAAGQPATPTGEKKQPKEHQHKPAEKANATARNAQPRAQRQAAQPSARQQRSMRRLQEFQERKRAAVWSSIRRKLLRWLRHLRWNKMQEFAANYYREKAGNAAAPADSTPARKDDPMAEASVVGEKRGISDLDPQAQTFAPGGSAAPKQQQQPWCDFVDELLGLADARGAGEAKKGQAKAACDPLPAQEQARITAELKAAGPGAIRRDARGRAISLRRRET